MDKASVRILLRLSSEKHLEGMKAEINRLMNRIYDDENYELVDPFKTKVDDLHDSTQGSRSRASNWLVYAAALYKDLQQNYNYNGEPKN